MSTNSGPSTQSSSEAPAPTAAATKAAAPAANSPIRRALEWVWQGAALAEVERKHRRDGSRALELSRRAKVCIELAEHAINPTQSLGSGSALAQGCELYRQAVYWGLLARRAQARASGESAPAAGEDSAATEPSAVWKNADRAAISGLFADERLAAAVDEALHGSFAELAELPQAELLSLAEGLRVFAESLLDPIEAAQLELERVWLRRFARLALVAATLVVLVLGVAALRESAALGSDVAHGKPWVASSRYNVGGCPSPLQKCPESVGYFFHTNEEEQPWLEIDLEQRQKISGVRVTNREDCCADRIVPLVLAVSVDHRTWTEVARSTSEFKRWATSFAPVDARWVKLYIPHHGLLHLSEVRILR